MSRSISEINEIEDTIIKMVCYFDIFNYPLTIKELQRWFLSKTINQDDLKIVLTESDFLKNKISQKEEFYPAPFIDCTSRKKVEPVHKRCGVYFLKGREEIINVRKEREAIALGKIVKAKKICRRLLFINPFIKGVAICNDLGYLNAPKESDIDLFIITQKNRIWLARFLLVFPIKLFGLRPTVKNKPSFAEASAGKKDKICVSFLITEDKLNLKEIILPDAKGMPDIYFIYWLCHLFPIYKKNNLWPDFYQANSWLKDFLPNFIESQNVFKDVVLSKVENPEVVEIDTGFFANTQNDKLINYLEKFCRWFQLKILPKSLKEKNGQGLGVIINDQMLKFHNPDKREYYRRILFDKLRGFTKS